VVVTGVGIVTSYGIGWESNAEGFRWGHTTFRPVTLFDVTRQRVKVAAEVDLPRTLPSSRLPERKQRRIERAARLLLFAADEALCSAHWRSHDPTAVVLGTTSGGMTRGEEFFREAMASPKRNRLQATRVSYYLAQRQALDLAEAYGLSGPVTIIRERLRRGSECGRTRV
jgi:3-oxoacyl-[acyl-carrier-protein] synthase II